jgi:hypothetical protein
LEPGNYFSTSCYLWLPHRRFGIEREHVDHTEDQGRRVDGIFWLSESFTASSYIPTLSAKVRMPMADAIQHNLQNPTDLTPAHALLSCMRQSSSADVLASAERVIQHIINTYSEPNLNSRIQSRAAKLEDPLRQVQ